VYQTSENDTFHSYERAYNNGLLIANQPSVYADYVRYFDRLSAAYASRVTRTFNNLTGDSVDTSTLATHDIETWSYPRAPKDDPVIGQLGSIPTVNRCANVTGSAPGPLHTNIDVAMNVIRGRSDVIQLLGYLSRAGCHVTVIYAAIELDDLAVLSQDGVALHQLCTSTHGKGRPTTYVHSKYFLIDGSDRGLGGNRRILFTGSANWTSRSLTTSDDRVIRYVESSRAAPVFHSYAENFSLLLQSSRTTPEKGPSCDVSDG
jgi:phosphatidylserine/phosphatidylglycerophosphate/cardiolipin synthase-like enzyme